jgi:hypothetical protein
VSKEKFRFTCQVCGTHELRRKWVVPEAAAEVVDVYYGGGEYCMVVPGSCDDPVPRMRFYCGNCESPLWDSKYQYGPVQESWQLAEWLRTHAGCGYENCDLEEDEEVGDC